MRSLRYAWSVLHGSGTITRLPRNAPLPHRIAHLLAASSFRGHRYCWALATCVSKLPPVRSILIGPNDGFDLPLGLDDVLEERIYRGTHEQAEMSLAARLVPPGGTCIDIGANIGLYTLLLAALVGPRGRVIAFEPSPDTRARLERASAGIPGVIVLPYALGSEESVRRLVHSEATHAWSNLRNSDDSGATFSDVSVRRLDEVLEIGKSQPIDFLKLDVEGWEVEVLKGATKLLSSGRLCSAIVEVSPQWGDTHYVDDLLGRPGYHGFVVSARKSPSHLRLIPTLLPYYSSPEIQFDLLLLRDDKLSLVSEFIAR